MNKIAVLLSGRGSNFRAIYENIKSGQIKDCEVAVVISDKADAKGLEYAREEGLNTAFFDPKATDRQTFNRKIIDKIKAEGCTLVVLAGYMRIISAEFVEAFRNRILNIHPSLLPSFPGLDVHRKAIEYGVKFSGCTVHFVDEKMDNGPIIKQAVVPVYDGDTEDDLADRILEQEHKIYPECVKLFLENKIKIIGRRTVIE